ncbi:M50 family membrane-associated zinc metalloprotease [Candidatus Walczuchella monophlebidarum]|uniref:Zinc metalloprotease n=1 Tax=Candidatus Walczuchella monophlebidarum TaxID=1415657 RepID=A0A068DT42_9FLAO|nr:M50 family membrane-associated zinc metalloprotease [Candidatus Walczuchella monophlebidarum]
MHELGHFLSAKLFKIRVYRFVIFFDPWFSIFEKKIGSTVYGIGWLPLGGYVKINQEQITRPSKPAWQRLIVMLSGVIFNVLLSIAIFSCLLFHYGETYLPIKNIKYGLTVDERGIKNGDIIRNGKKIERIQDLPKSILLGKDLTVERNKKHITSPPQLRIFPRIPAIVKNVIKQSPAGVKKGDKIIGINFHHVLFIDQVLEILNKKKSDTIRLFINRNGERYEMKIKMVKNNKIGRNLGSISDMQNLLPLEKKYYGFLDSLLSGTKKTWESLTAQINIFKQVFNIKTQAYKKVGSILSLTKSFSPNWDWEYFWIITATFSIWIAFFNVLPIPSLDGGYVFFIIIEMIMGRQISEKFVEKSTLIGIRFLSLLMILVLIWDIFRLI